MLTNGGVRSTEEEMKVEAASRLITGISAIDEAKQSAPVSVAMVSDPTHGDPTMGRGTFIATSGKQNPPFDMQSLHNAYVVDSYVFQSIEKYISLILKRGWRVDSKNKDAVEYIKKRLMAMSYATKIPTNALLRAVVEDLVLFGNAFLIKVRARTDNPVSRLRLTGFRGNRPVVGLFPSYPPSMVAVTNDKGKIVKWEHYVGGMKKREWPAADVIHLKKNCPRGAIYGVSHLVPVLEDIRILRQIEQNILMLLYRNLHPLTHIKVGVPVDGANPATAIQVGQLRLDHIKNTFESMAPDGALITEADVSIDLLGSESRALRAEPYMTQFRDRAFAGLGVSDTTMGKSSTTNRSTAEQLAAEMHDAVRAWQGFISDSIEWQVFFEFLYEGGYDPLNQEGDFVKFIFTEVDIDAEIKREDHLTQLYVQNVITHEELRLKIGLDPLEESMDKDIYSNKVSIPVALAKMGVVASDSGEWKMATKDLIKPATTSTSSTSRSTKASFNSPQLPLYTRMITSEIAGLEDAILDRMTGIYREIDEVEELGSYTNEELKFSTDILVTENAISRVFKKIYLTAIREGIIFELQESALPLESYPNIEDEASKRTEEIERRVSNIILSFSEKLYGIFTSVPYDLSEAMAMVSPHLSYLKTSLIPLVSNEWEQAFKVGIELSKSSVQDTLEE